MESLSDLEPVSSTTEESDDPEKTYAVEMILAERKLAGDHRYLVKWEGEQYPLGFSTWEPRSNLGSATISAWERFKKQSGRRTRENFSIHDYWAAAEARFKKKRDLHKDRNRRRELLGQQPKPYNTCFEDELENLRRNLEDFEDSKSVANDVIDVEMLDVDDDKTEPSAPSLTLSQAERSTASRNNKTHTTRRTGMFTNPESFSTHAGSYFTGSSSLNSPNPSVGLDTHHHPHRPMHSLIPRVASVPASERSPERARKTAINSRKSTEQFKNVFIDGRKRKQGTSLSSAMSDQSKASKWLSFRKQNIGNKQLRDGEGLRAPSALPTSWMKLGSETSEFVRRDPNCRGKQQGRDELVTQEAGTLFAAEITSNLTAQDDASNDQSISADVTTSSLPSLLVVGGQRKMKKRSVHWGDISEIPPNSYSDSEPGELFVSQEASSHLPLSKPCQLEGTESQSTILTFIGLTDGGKPPWLQQIWRKDRLVFTHTCTALDWISAILQFTQSKIHQGQVAADSNFRNISLVANRLKAAGQGVVCFDKDFCILVAPTRCEEWSKAFLKEVNDATGYLLAYIVFQPLENFGSMVAPIFCPDLEAPRENPRDQPLSDLERVLGINYDGLLSPRGRDAQQQNFFLMFPHSAEQEAMLVRQLLLRDKANCRIWTILVSGNWKAFTKCDHGTTIVHEDFVWMLHTLPGLSDLLADSERVNQNFWLWKRPFISPTQPLDAKSAPLSGIELRPIFPQGHAWLMTPSFLISQPEEAYRFFKSISSPTVKRRKLVLCSDIEEMLLDLAMRTNSPSSSRTASSEAIQARAKLWCNIVFLIRDSASAIDDWDELSSSPLILAPEMLDGNDEQSLVNWFGWWAITNMEHLRTFSVIGSSHRAQISGRISRIITVPKYLAEPEIRYKCLVLDLVPLTKDLAEHLTDLFFEAARSHRGSFLSFYRFPVSYWEPELQQPPARCLRNYDQWIDFSTSVLRTRRASIHVPSRAATYNTCLGFFYTFEGDYIPSEPARRPWVAILRPLDVSRISNWNSTELLIWDHQAWLHYQGHNHLCLEDLIEAQRELIRSLKKHVESSLQLPLRRVWLGGRAPVGDRPEKAKDALEVTLNWALELTRNKFHDLPPYAGQLFAKSWKLVDCDRPEKYCSLSSAVGDADLPESSSKRRMVFPPPHTPDKQEPGQLVCSWESNTLYMWAQGAQVRSAGEKGEFFFEPTSEWYGRQVNNGQGLNHISVSNWEAVKRRHFKSNVSMRP